MRKVSIITLIGANNIGAFLQGFALYKTVELLGFQTEFLTMPSKKENKGKLYKIKRYLSQKNFKLLLFKIKSGEKYNDVRRMLHTKPFNVSEILDIVIIGSDEMWSINNKIFQHYPQYFGKQITARRIISYAPSAGKTTFAELVASSLDFSSFQALSVRDRRTFELVKNIDKRIPIVALDPTFLFEDYDEYIPNVDVGKDFIMVYSYGMSKDEIKMAKTFAVKQNLPLYGVGTYNSWCNKNIIVTPFEFLAYLKNARYVITSTFHGAALSIKFNKEFAVCIENSEKLSSLISEFKLESLIVTNTNTIQDILNKRIDYVRVNEVLEGKKKVSMSFLKDALCD